MDQKFDLNIERVLENWEPRHAIREVIANALDEQVLTRTPDVTIFDDGLGWHVRDFGRGVHYRHLTQKENEEKLRHPNLIGKFGVGLKDALATFDRHDIAVTLRSKFGDITLTKAAKQDFADIVTLHARVVPPTEPSLIGTDVILQGCNPHDIEEAKAMFLRFSGDLLLEGTSYGSVHRRIGNFGRVYINGALVAEEENFLFSYNITSLTAIIKRALNRERSNVGRTAYADRVQAILLACKLPAVAQELVQDLTNYERGTIHDELKWSNVAVHATKIMNAEGSAIFLTPSQLVHAADFVDRAVSDGLHIVTIPENLSLRISGETDIMGGRMNDLGAFVERWNDSFVFRFVESHQLSPAERSIFAHTDRILALIGGRPRNVNAIRISETMRPDSVLMEAQGLWISETGEIIIKRSQLGTLTDYAATLLHEAAHATSGAGDITFEFESELTSYLGTIATSAL